MPVARTGPYGQKASAHGSGGVDAFHFFSVTGGMPGEGGDDVDQCVNGKPAAVAVFRVAAASR